MDGYASAAAIQVARFRPAAGRGPRPGGARAVPPKPRGGSAEVGARCEVGAPPPISQHPSYREFGQSPLTWPS